MDIRKIKKLIELIQSTGVAEIEIHEGEESVRITREVNKVTPMMMTTQQPMIQAPPFSPSPEIKSDQSQQHSHTAPSPADSKHAMKAPMVGTVYLSPSPGAKPFVEIGQTVKAGDVICLIEAMKMFNQIEVDRSGTVTARLIDNGTPVEFNQPLFLIE